MPQPGSARVVSDDAIRTSRRASWVRQDAPEVVDAERYPRTRELGHRVGTAGGARTLHEVIA